MPSNTEQFADALKSEGFRDVRFNKGKLSGTAAVPNVGVIEFHESGNDPAVIVNFTFLKSFKGTAETTINFIETLRGAWANSD